MESVKNYIKGMALIPDPVIAELGTRRWNPDFSTVMNKEFVPHSAKAICMDFQDGTDVDEVLSVYNLSKKYENYFDGIICMAMFEHLEFPWIAADEIIKALKTGGLTHIMTVQTFPLHGYPNDFYRFSVESLRSLFGKLEILSCEYDYPCKIISDHLGTQENAFLNVTLTGRKRI